MKHICVHLTFKFSRAVERKIIKLAKAIEGAQFKGDDDLRDALHEILSERIDSDAGTDGVLFDSIDSIETLKSEIKRNDQPSLKNDQPSLLDVK